MENIIKEIDSKAVNWNGLKRASEFYVLWPQRDRSAKISSCLEIHGAFPALFKVPSHHQEIHLL